MYRRNSTKEIHWLRQQLIRMQNMVEIKKNSMQNLKKRDCAKRNSEGTLYCDKKRTLLSSGYFHILCLKYKTTSFTFEDFNLCIWMFTGPAFHGFISPKIPRLLFFLPSLVGGKHIVNTVKTYKLLAQHVYSFARLEALCYIGLVGVWCKVFPPGLPSM